MPEMRFDYSLNDGDAELADKWWDTLPGITRVAIWDDMKEISE